MILAFDPGVCTGWATCNARGMLSACGVIAFEGFWFEVTQELLNASSFMNVTSTLVVERPQVYDPRLQKGDQADIVATSVRAGVLLQRFRPWGRLDAERLPTPREWKGSVDKDVHNARVLAKLSPEERARIPKLPKKELHNLIDAVGLALWAAGR